MIHNSHGINPSYSRITKDALKLPSLRVVHIRTVNVIEVSVNFAWVISWSEGWKNTFGRTKRTLLPECIWFSGYKSMNGNENFLNWHFGWKTFLENGEIEPSFKEFLSLFYVRSKMDGLNCPVWTPGLLNCLKQRSPLGDKLRLSHPT